MDQKQPFFRAILKRVDEQTGSPNLHLIEGTALQKPLSWNERAEKIKHARAELRSAQSLLKAAEASLQTAKQHVEKCSADLAALHQDWIETSGKDLGVET